MSKQALVLFAHGARDPRWAEPFQRLQAAVQKQSADLIVALGFLELMSPRLPDVVARLAEQNVDTITIVPVFLGQGGHVLRDLPVIVEELEKAYPAMTFSVADAVGEDPAVLQAMAAYCLRCV